VDVVWRFFQTLYRRRRNDHDSRTVPHCIHQLRHSRASIAQSGPARQSFVPRKPHLV
jgi:hypothetical protein